MSLSASVNVQRVTLRVVIVAFRVLNRAVANAVDQSKVYAQNVVKLMSLSTASVLKNKGFLVMAQIKETFTKREPGPQRAMILTVEYIFSHLRYSRLFGLFSR